MENMYGKIHVKIKSLTPLLMNRLNPETLKTKSTKRFQSYDEKEQAEKSAYITKVNGKKQLYIPAYAIYSMIIKTAAQYKAKRTSVASLLAGTMRVEPEKILLGHCNYEIDTRPVVIQRARVLRSRAKIPEWTATFTIIYNKKALPQAIIEKLKEILEDAGTRVGILDYRPQHKGWFGTFTVEKLEVMN